MPIEAGQLIAERYRVQEKIGAGGIGTVYRAIQHPLERPVALKMLRTELTENSELRRRFQREARAVASLSHPNIAVVHDFGVDAEDRLYMALELVVGESLEALGKRGGLTMPVIAAVFRQVLTGLAHAHARGVIHRDIKPANILVARDEDGMPNAKIVDFGIAAITGISGFDDTESTGSGVIIGTPQYMAPEQARGDRAISATVDVYAVGLTLYWALTGRHAFDGTNPMDVLAAQLHQPPPAITPREGLEIPEGLGQLVFDALTKSPRDRLPSAIAFRSRLVGLLGTGSDARIIGGFGTRGPLAAETAEHDTVLESMHSGFSGAAIAEPHADTFAGVQSFGAHGPVIRSDIPLVGRDDERRRLLERAATPLERGRGVVITLEGPAGYGKSRMANWIVAQLGEHYDVLGVRGAFLRDAGSSLRGVRDAFEQLLQLQGAPVRRVSEWVARQAGVWGLRDANEWEAVVRFLRPSAGTPDPSERRSPEALFETLFRILVVESERRPIAMHLDDVHWGGIESARFLEFVAAELVSRPARVTLIATVLTGEVGTQEFEASMRHLSRYDGDTAVRHSLEPLSAPDAHRMLRAILPVSSTLADALVQRADGNEMHLVQLVRYLADSRLLVPGQDGWAASGEVNVEQLLPPSLSELVGARLKDLETTGKPGARRLEILRRCAVIGGGFPFGVLERMLQIEDRADLLEAIDEDVDALVDLGMLELQPQPMDDEVHFATDIVRDVLAEQMAQRRTTRKLHLYAADAKVAVYGDAIDKVAGELVVHFEQARDFVRAFRFARTAALVAQRSHRPHDAIGFLDRALAFLSITGEDDMDARRARHDLRLRAAGLLLATGEYVRARLHYEAVVEDAPTPRDATLAQFGLAKLARIRGAFDAAEQGYRAGMHLAMMLDDDELRARGDIGLARVEWHRGRHEDAQRLATEALELAQSRGPEAQVPEAIWLLADIARSRGDHAAARRGFQDALERYTAADDRLGIAKSHAMLAMTARATRDLDEAERHYLAALALYRAYGDRKGIAHQLNGLGEVYRFHGDFAQASEKYREAVEMFQRLDLPYDTAIALTNLGIVARDSGDFGRAEEALRQAFETADRIGHAYVISGAGLSLAHVLAMLGRLEESESMLAHALAVADAGHLVDPDYAVPLEKLAELRASQGDEATARNLLERALDMWTNLGREADRERVARRLAESSTAL